LRGIEELGFPEAEVVCEDLWQDHPGSR
jgi:hypothetical protein